jgi:hypothetical protein
MFAPSILETRALDRTSDFPGSLTIKRATRATAKRGPCSGVN